MGIAGFPVLVASLGLYHGRNGKVDQQLPLRVLSFQECEFASIPVRLKCTNEHLLAMR
jgi:hypothetical protein